jgi:hypothetical protein
MEAINHCLLKREELAAQAQAAGLGQQVLIPKDGAWVS